MKHFHINDLKAKLAHDIFNETQLLLELEKTRSALINEVSDSSFTYMRVQTMKQKLKSLSDDIKKQKVKINGMQAEHDKIC